MESVWGGGAVLSINKQKGAFKRQENNFFQKETQNKIKLCLSENDSMFPTVASVTMHSTHGLRRMVKLIQFNGCGRYVLRVPGHLKNHIRSNSVNVRRHNIDNNCQPCDEN